YSSEVIGKAYFKLFVNTIISKYIENYIRCRYSIHAAGGAAGRRDKIKKGAAIRGAPVCKERRRNGWLRLHPSGAWKARVRALGLCLLFQRRSVVVKDFLEPVPLENDDDENREEKRN